MANDTEADKREAAYELFDRLMDLPAVEQRKILKAECDDPEVRAWVVDLIAADSTDGGLLDSDLMPAVGLNTLTDQAQVSQEADQSTEIETQSARTPEHEPAQIYPQQGQSPVPETIVAPVISQQAVPARRPPLQRRTGFWIVVLAVVTALGAAGWIQAWRLDTRLQGVAEDVSKAKAQAAIALHGQAVTLYRQRNYVEARLRFSEAIQLGEEAWGKDHVNVGVFRSNHANNLLGLAQLDTAEAEFVTAIEILERSYGESSTQVADARMGYGELLLRERAWSAAAREFRQVVDNRNDNPQVETWRRGVAALRLGECLLRLSKEQDAAAMLSEGLRDLRTGPRSRITGELARGERLLREARRGN